MILVSNQGLSKNKLTRGQLFGNRIPRNTIFGNNFFGYDILSMFDMQIKFLRIFNKFSKIPLMEVVVNDGLWQR